MWLIKLSLRSVLNFSILPCLSIFEKTSFMKTWQKDLLIFKMLIKIYLKWWSEIQLRVLLKTSLNLRNFYMRIAILCERTITSSNDFHSIFICNLTKIQRLIFSLSCVLTWCLEVNFKDLMNILLMQMMNVLTLNFNINSFKVWWNF